jgi:uncharacterized protein YvpB
MSSTTAPKISPAAGRPTAPPKPSPSRTAYRPSGETTFGAALRAAANEAVVARYTSPNAARIGAPVNPSAGATPALDMSLPSPGTPAPAGIDARLWESLSRGVQFRGTMPGTSVPGSQGTFTGVNMAQRAEQLDPAALAMTPAMIREQGQAFLSSIDGFDQTSVGEYDSVAQARAWGYSTCSAASLTAVLKAAGQDVKIADVMKQMPGGMTIQLGLVSRPSLVNAANQFGAKATDDVQSYEALKAATDKGQPVLVDIRNGKFPEGHWIVVTGVDENGVRCADSSRYDLTSIPRGEFQRSWSSRGIRIEGLNPTAAPARANVQSA